MYNDKAREIEMDTVRFFSSFVCFFVISLSPSSVINPFVSPFGHFFFSEAVLYERTVPASKGGKRNAGDKKGYRMNKGI